MVLKKREEGEHLDRNDIQIANNQGQHDFVVCWYEEQYEAYGEHHDLASLVSALRHAGRSAQAAEIAKREVNQHNIQSAPVWTSYGAALADLGDLEGAERCALSGLALEISYYPHNLLGRVYFLQGDPERGECHFDIALELGSQPRSLRKAMENAIEELSESTGRETARYLLKKDSVKYNWARQYL